MNDDQVRHLREIRARLKVGRVGDWYPECVLLLALVDDLVAELVDTREEVDLVADALAAERALTEQLRAALERIVGHTELEPFDTEHPERYRWVSLVWIQDARAALEAPS